MDSKQIDKVIHKTLESWTEYSKKSVARQDAECWLRFLDAYEPALNGDIDAAETAWCQLEDWGRVTLTHYLWELREAYRISPQVWARILELTWKRGKGGCLLFRESLRAKTVIKMFSAACALTLMYRSGEHERLNNLPEEFVAWRGTSSTSRHQWTGFSWTTDKDQAAWFAYRNSDGDSQPLLLHAVVRRSSVLACFNYEREVVVNPRRPRKQQSVEILPKENRWKRLDELRKIIEAKKEVSLPLAA